VVFLKRTLQGGGGKWPPGVSRVLCHLEIKFQRLYPCFRGKLFNGPHANLVRWLLYPEIQDGARKQEVVLFWHVWLYLKDIWVNYYAFGRQIECHHCYLDHSSSWCHISRWRRKSTTIILNLISSTCNCSKGYVNKWLCYCRGTTRGTCQ